MFSLLFCSFHPQVAGFFFAQVFAILSWSVFKSVVIAKVFHVLFITAALATLIPAVIAIVYDSESNGNGTIGILHAWIGIGAIGVFGINYLLGLLKFLISSNAIRESHRVIGCTAVALTAAAILLGTVTELNDCFAVTYSALPLACKIANGMGIAVAGSAILTITVVSMRLPIPVQQEKEESFGTSIESRNELQNGNNNGNLYLKEAL